MAAGGGARMPSQRWAPPHIHLSERHRMSDPDMDRLADLLDLPHGSPDVAYAACERIARLSSAQDRNSREFYEAIGLDLDQSLPYAMAWAVVLLNRRDRRIADLERGRA